jgi:hypothetical protein
VGASGPLGFVISPSSLPTESEIDASRSAALAEGAIEARVRKGVMSGKKKSAAFRQGRFGARESHLYEFHGRDYPCESEEERVERLAAESIYEGLLYLRRREPDFEVTSVHCIGLVTLLSGSPLD